MKVLKTIENFIYALVIVVLMVVAGLAAMSAFPLPNSIRLYTVQSGSMEPAIKTGSIVITKPQSDYSIGDVITFNNTDGSFTTTHRLVGIEENKFQTKGDANDAPDGTSTAPNLVIGKVVFSVPYLGYPVNFAKTREGLIVLIVIPATLIIYSELVSIKNELVRMWHRKKAPVTDETENT